MHQSVDNVTTPTQVEGHMEPNVHQNLLDHWTLPIKKCPGQTNCYDIHRILSIISTFSVFKCFIKSNTEVVITRSTHNPCDRHLGSKIRKKVSHCKPQFYSINVECKGVYITQTYLRDDQSLNLSLQFALKVSFSLDLYNDLHGVSRNTTMALDTCKYPEIFGSVLILTC